MPGQTLYFVWGPPRSGTTWLFNVLKDMLALAEIPHYPYVDGLPLPPEQFRDSVLLKAHRADPTELIGLFAGKLNLSTLVMLRRPDLAFRSLLRTQAAPRPELLDWLEADVEALMATLPHLHEVLVCREEWIAPRAEAIIAQISAIHALGLTDEDCRAIADRFERERVRETVAQLSSDRGWTMGFADFDPTTHWHGNHIGPEFQDDIDLTDDEVERLAVLGHAIDAMTVRDSLFNHTNEKARIALATATPRAYLVARNRDLVHRSGGRFAPRRLGAALRGIVTAR